MRLLFITTIFYSIHLFCFFVAGVGGKSKERFDPAQPLIDLYPDVPVKEWPVHEFTYLNKARCAGKPLRWVAGVRGRFTFTLLFLSTMLADPSKSGFRLPPTSCIS